MPDIKSPIINIYKYCIEKSVNDLWTTYICFLLILIYLILISACSSKNVQEDKNITIDDLIQQCQIYARSGDLETCDSLAVQLKKLSIEYDDRRGYAYAYYFLGTYRPELGNTAVIPREKNLLIADSINKIVSDDALSCRILNSKAIWEMAQHKQYAQAIKLLTEALKIAEKRKANEECMILESNLSEVYRLLDDTLEYSHDANLFHLAERTKNRAVAAIAAFHMVQFGMRNNLPERITAADLQKLKNCDTLKHLAKLSEAQLLQKVDQAACEKLALELLNDSLILTHDERGAVFQLLSENALRGGKFTTGKEYAVKAKEEYTHQSHGIQYTDIYRLEALNAEGMNDFKSANDMWKIYIRAKDSLETMQNRETINRLRIEYQIERKEAALKLVTEKARRNLAIILGVAALFITAAVCYFVYLHRRQHYYDKIVSQYRLMLSYPKADNPTSVEFTKDKIRNKDHEGNEYEDRNEKISHISSLTADKADLIFKQISDLFDSEEIYRDKNLTRETLAERLGVNRTYISEAIKYKTGLSYTQFIGRCRINKAIGMLLEGCDTPVRVLADEVGFVSQTPFFAFFKAETGMTPAAFKKTCKKT